MKDHNIFDWYWIVAGDTSQVFSSKSGDYVSSSDATYVAWKADGTLPTQIDSEESLGNVLAPYLIRPVAPTVLDAYKGQHAEEVIRVPLYKLLFQMYNDIRVLKGQQPITAAQARNAMKGLM